VRLLLDTHTLLWWLVADDQLSTAARSAIEDYDNPVYVSAASAWEVATKHRLGKLPEIGRLANDFASVVAQQGFLALDITLEQGQRAGALPGKHKDPFDRMLIAQSQVQNLVLVSNEIVFDYYGVSRLW
jgi:PIN domain nuclease of toxin-antitoxin system